MRRFNTRCTIVQEIWHLRRGRYVIQVKEDNGELRIDVRSTLWMLTTSNSWHDVKVASTFTWRTSPWRTGRSVCWVRAVPWVAACRWLCPPFFSFGRGHGSHDPRCIALIATILISVWWRQIVEPLQILDVDWLLITSAPDIFRFVRGWRNHKPINIERMQGFRNLTSSISNEYCRYWWITESLDPGYVNRTCVVRIFPCIGIWSLPIRLSQGF